MTLSSCERSCAIPMFCWKLVEKRRTRLVFMFFCICAISLAVVYVNNLCAGQQCLGPHTVHSNAAAGVEDAVVASRRSGGLRNVLNSELSAYSRGHITKHNFDDHELSSEFPVDIDGEDVLVFLHIQKTGGTTFGRHLVRNLQLDEPCQCGGRFRKTKRCKCLNSKKHVWLFSRYSTGWVCGLHADWTELKNCVKSALDKREKEHRARRYLYFTIIRDPLWRYLSEWKHVQRGSTWLAAKLKCNGRSATLKEVPFCWTGQDWTGVSLQEFMSCPHNLASNRQTRMLANLSKIGCYNQTYMNEDIRNEVMLESAKENIRDLAFFGLLEFQNEMQYVFERTFGLKFREDFVQYNTTHASRVGLSDDIRQKVLELNKLDVALYQYAKDLFLQRYHRMKEKDRLSGRTDSANKHRRQKFDADHIHNHLTPSEDE